MEGGAQVLRDRLIPAHAGKTRSNASPARAAWAHPRSRGENQGGQGGCPGPRGSSPLTRGKPPAACCPGQIGRLIPAHAGKTRKGVNIWHVVRAHPRSRGENARHRRAHHRPPGSSPLTRGKRLLVGVEAQGRGLIPAHAGKTGEVLVLPTAARAHPRSRGENGALHHFRERVQGSSPLTRGKPGGGLGDQARGRLIPAHAGKTRTRRSPSRTPGAHPRSRGENSTGSWRIRRSQGSSPLTRGKRTATRWGAGFTGLIPAHAGKTSTSTEDGRTCRAHPRSRGENLAGAGGLIAVWGSSPLTRGKPLGMTRADLAKGLIPAHAGKTVGGHCSLLL